MSLKKSCISIFLVASLVGFGVYEVANSFKHIIKCRDENSICSKTETKRKSECIAFRGVQGGDLPLKKMRAPMTFYNLPNDVVYSPIATPNLTGSRKKYDKLELDYARYLMKIQFDCRRTDRAGKAEDKDGGWEVCLDPPYNLTSGGCLIYSFGINNEWSFDDYMDKKHSCEVHSFDPSMGKEDFNRSKNIHFHNLGLGGKNGTNDKRWMLYTLGCCMRLLGHTNRILDYLKIDIENDEWESLETMFKEQVLKQVKQLGIEFHRPPDSRRVRIISTLYDLGFRIFYTKRNYFTRLITGDTRRTVYLYETHLVNINFLKNN